MVHSSEGRGRRGRQGRVQAIFYVVAMPRILVMCELEVEITPKCVYADVLDNESSTHLLNANGMDVLWL